MAHSHHLSREEQAKVEIGHTETTRGVSVFLTAVFIAAIAAVPLLQTAYEWRRLCGGSDPGRRWPVCFDAAGLLPTRAEWRAVAEADGLRATFAALRTTNNRILRDIGRYESDLKDRSDLVQWLVPRVQSVVTGLLKGGNEDAYCGRGGWLFYRRDVDYAMGRGFLDPRVMARRASGGSENQAAPQPDPVPAIVLLRDALAARGIDLVVVPAPVKPVVHPERFSARYTQASDPVQNPSYAALMERLAAAKVHVFDPAPLLVSEKARTGRPQYLATDTHWTPEGMQAVAAGLAGFVQRIASLPPSPSLAYAAVERAVTNTGDIAAMLRLPAKQGFYAPEAVTIRQVALNGAPWKPDPAADVLLLGDSFANIYSLEPMGWGGAAGLAEHLSLALARPVDTIVRNDAGSWATRDMLAKELARGNDRLAGKRVVVWEFAARELASGDWKRIELPAASVRPGATADRAAVAGEWVTGVVAAVSDRPDKGAVYRDFIMKLHVRQMKRADGSPVGDGEGVVHVLAMSNRVIRAVAGVTAGQELRLRLRPWDEVSRRYGSLKSGVLEDVMLEIDKPLYWGEVGELRPAAMP